ncbi:sensor histidine kinase [Kitasatospora kifunensis]|uniref:histidine kinase n=1 Tax=Kitasatospora kifunensis TaxID=58351 RepID=A0A7W7R0C3_KITKI|nr:sensor histidine kinase [Kitasatospora kifunensis]MBB4923034.1 signal transduction histidine kinase [Kitasatospora kifunensis]
MSAIDQLPAALGRRFPSAARGLAALRGWLLDERYPIAVDLAFSLVVLALASAAHGRDLSMHPWVWLLQLGLILPLAFRRRAPLAVFGVIAGVAFVQWLTYQAMPADIAVLLALYTVAGHSSRRRTLLAYLIAELGVALVVSNLRHVVELADPLHAMFKAAFMLSGATTAAAVLGLNVRARRAQLRALRERAHELERQRDQQAALAVAEERSRIAREMHDIVTHNLSVMVALADGAVYANPIAPEKATAAMRQSAETGRQAITDMRRFLGVLRADEPDALRHPQPGLGQLTALVAQVRAAGLPTELHQSGEAATISPGAQLTVYRLVQESLTNTLKHAASGARAQVTVECTADTVRVEVRDDGRALHPSAVGAGADALRESGHGLAGMRERVAAYGGGLTAGPLPQGGWRVAATLDLGPDPQEAPR